MIVKFNDLYKNYLKGENRIKIIFFLAFIFIFLSQYYGKKILWIMISSSILAIIQLYFIIKQINYMKNFNYIFLSLEEDRFKIINDYVTIDEVNNCSMNDNIIEIVDLNKKRYTINIKWVEENKKNYVVDYFKKIRSNINKTVKIK